MAKLKLIPINEQPLLVWGIVSSHPPHKLCWLINQSMDWNLSRRDDIIVSGNLTATPNHGIWPDTLGIEASYARYCYDDDGWLYTVEVIVIKEDSEPLLAELKNFDFLMVAHGETAHFPKNVKDVIEQQDGIHSVLTLMPQLIKEFPKLQAYIG